jgi:hypothetical protein
VTVALALAAVAAGCGGGIGIRFYRGTETTPVVSGGSTSTTTATGVQYTVMPSQTGTWLFLAGSTDYVATLMGTTLNFMSQDLSTSRSSGTTNTATSIMLSNGTGNMTPENLSTNLTVTATQTGSSATYTIVFNGNRE